MFQSGFWAPVWYYEPAAKFPAPNCLPARHLGNASEHGEYFTYKVWTLAENKWEDRCELVRDIVTMRQHTNASARADYTDEALTMSRNPCPKRLPKRKQKSKNPEVPNNATAGQKRKKSGKTVISKDIEDSIIDKQSSHSDPLQFTPRS